MENNFKVGDKVYDILHKWGVIDQEIEGYFFVKLEDASMIIFEKKYNLLSFTEYTLQGFTQERPMELPEVGELCLFYDDEEDLEEGDAWYGKFKSYKPNEERPYKANDNSSWSGCKRIKILD